jgi:hypothetical protein
MAKTKLERAAAIDEQMTQLANQKKKLLQQHREAERKARTRRLIQRGAILEGFIPDPETYTEDEIQAFLKETLATKFAKDALRRIKPTAPPKAETRADSTDKTPPKTVMSPQAAPAHSGGDGGARESG